MLKTRFSICWCFALVAVLLAAPALAGECGDPGTPASTVPQFRSENPGQSIWPLDNFNNVVFKPASDIPARRDSTDYITQTIPGNGSGHELFQDAVVLDDNDDWLFVAYNAGLQVWDLRIDPADPDRATFKDGWLNQFEYFPDAGEGDTYVEAIDAISAPSGTDIFVALAGRSGHGISVWRYSVVTQLATQIFQSARVWFRDVELINHSNGRTYALAAASDASNGGIHVFDITSANSSPCFDDSVAPETCPMNEGTLGDMTDGGYVDTLQVGSETYVVASDGSGLPADQLKVEIWLLTDPDNPSSATRKYSGLNTNSRGVQLFEMSSKYYLAVIDAISANNTVNRVYDVTSCLDANGCASAGSALWSYTNRAISGNYQYLTVSHSGSRTFLYYGLETTPLNGARVEQLFDISSLANLSLGGGSVFEITDAGADYTDPCSAATIDYWGDYYSNNAYGLDNVLPRHGVFKGKYFYRTAYGVLDVHELVQDEPQASIVTTVGNGPHWMGDPIGFGTLAGGDCSPLATQWCWLVEPEGGSNVSYTPLPLNEVTGCDPSFTEAQAFTFSCDGPGRCDDTAVGVAAWNLACGAVEDGVQSPADLTVSDPAVEAAASGDSDIQECQTSNLTATLVGRGPANWRWEVDGVEIDGCDGSLGSSTNLAAVGSQNCSYTADQFEDIFADGFESGDCTLWSAAFPANCGAPEFLGPSKQWKGSGGVLATFRVWDPADGPENPLDTADVAINISTIGDPSWVTPGNPVSELVSGNQATLTAQADDTGTWDWEFEDPDGGETCTFPQSGTVSCTTQSTTGPSAQKSWSEEGTYEYRVTASNCRSSVIQTATGDVTIDPGIQPDITSFDFGSNPNTVCCGSLVFGDLRCVAGQTVEVKVDVAVTDPSFDFSFDLNRSANGSADSASFGSPVTPSATAGNSYFFEVVFGGSGVRWPAVRAESGSLDDFHEMFAGVSGESSTSLEIVSAGSCP